MYIAIAGNIGSGKTTLTNMLAKHYGWKKFLEPVDETHTSTTTTRIFQDGHSIWKCIS